MRALSNADLLKVWEAGTGLRPFERAVLLLRAACDDNTAIGQLSIGGRDRLLLELRTRTFGPRISAVIECPKCGNLLESDFDLSGLLEPGQQTTPDDVHFTDDGYEVHARLPNTEDLTYVARQLDPEVALLARCVLNAKYEGNACATADLPRRVVDGLEAHFATRDSLAEVTVALTCPACRQEFAALFDIVSFFWRELHDWSVRMLQQVHALATAYGWSETQVLSLTPQRRQIYLDMVGGA